jgi:hypothetical protein
MLAMAIEGGFESVDFGVEGSKFEVLALLAFGFGVGVDSSIGGKESSLHLLCIFYKYK